MIGRQLLHYVIEGKLGEGGMGVVYKGTDTLLRRPVAMKFLTKALPTDAAERKRFLREARSASAINHPNVCVIHAIEEAEEQQFLVMEYVEGVTLRKWVARKKAHEHANALPVRDAVMLAMQLANGLDAAHRKGIVHRDVKPENIMVNDDDHAKIMDFGLAKLIGESRLTRTGATVGTVAYMSPEQVQGGEIDQQSDVYSFGVVLYEMLTGTTPFQAEHAMGMMYAIVNSDPTPILEKRRETGPELGRIVMKCLAREKSARYTGMKPIIDDLGALIEGHETVLARTTGRSARGAAPSRWKERATTVIARRGILWRGVAIVVLAAAVLLLVRQQMEEGGPWLSVITDPPGSRVWINGKEVGITPLDHYTLPEGRIALRLLLASYHPSDTTLDLAAGQEVRLNVPLRFIETKKDSSQLVAAVDSATSGKPSESAGSESARETGPVVVGSVDALATSLVRQLAGTAGRLRGTVAVRPFTYQDTQFGSAFSRYFRTLLEHRATALTPWAVLSTDVGSGQSAHASAPQPDYEITGTYWDTQNRLRFFALLQDPRTREVAGRAEAVVVRKNLARLESRLTPGNMKQVMDDARVLGKTEGDMSDLQLELLTNKGMENLVFTEGDTLKTYVRVNKPCTVRVFYHAADGTRYALSGPDDLNIDYARINTPVLVDMAECAPPFGAELLQAFATTGRFDAIRTRRAEGGYFVLEDNLQKAMTATRGIRKVGEGSNVTEKRVKITTVAR